VLACLSIGERADCCDRLTDGGVGVAGAGVGRDDFAAARLEDRD
jgi:hypothetical protein